MSEASYPERKSKAEIERTVKMNGGTVVQSNNVNQRVICVADRSKCYPLYFVAE